MLPVRGGKSSRLAQVVIIATHADCVQCLRDSSGLYYDEDALRLLRELREEYALKLDISDTMYVLDARDATSVEIRQLKTFLGHCRNSLLQNLPRTNGLLIEVANQLPEWCVDDPFPVDTWSQFADRVRERVNPLCTEEHLLTLVQHLQYTGNLVYIESPSNDDMIALNPNWLCEDILGACISEEALRNIRVTGSFTMDDFQLLVCSEHTTQVISILEAFGVCVCCVVTEQQPKQSKRHRVGKKARSLKGMDFFQEATSPTCSERNRTRGRAVSFHVATRSAHVVSQFGDWDNIQLEAPRHNLIEMYPGLWDPPADASLYTYGGLELSASPGQFMHLMPRIQLQLRRDIAKMMEDVCVDTDDHTVSENSQNWDLTQWLHGSKVTVRESAIEILIKWHQSRQGILLITRCLPRYSRKAFWLLHSIVQLTCQMIEMVCPSLEFEANVLCSSDLATHDPDPGICDSNILVDHLMRLGKKAFYESERLDLKFASQCTGDTLSSDDLAESTFYSQVADELPSDGRPGTSRMVLRDILLFNQKLAICVAESYQQPLSCLRIPVIQHMARVLDVADQTKEVWIRFASHLNIPYSEETLDKLLSEQGSPVPPSLTGIALRTASKDASNSIGTLMIALRSIHCFDLIHYLHHAQLLLMFGAQTQPQQRCQPTATTATQQQQQQQDRNHDFDSLRAEDADGQMV
ncbi:unnamed protein product [Calicophoron daubneyi]|uniref:Uncharacterized protein n=1 Tax=Calicophoron daubneyi TaxID=300641 RepID=A0AAV2TTA8_CALDB